MSTDEPKWRALEPVPSNVARASRPCILLLCLFLLPSLASAAERASSLSEKVHAEISASLDQLEQGADPAATLAKLRLTFDRTIACASPRDLDAIREAAFALRLASQLHQVPPSARASLLKYLRANDELARTLVFLVNDANTPAQVYALLNRLREKRGQQPAKFPSLTAAICVVHDRPFTREVMANKLRSPDPLDIFDYFIANEPKLACPIRTAPAELLLYLVDTTSPVGEMNWAMQRYARQRMVGRLFFEIDYDVAHWETGAPKRVDQAGYSLPNILKFGGVCADQAYFATAVGKSIGVPAAMVRGANAETGHWWCGFFQIAPRSFKWNSDIGRYDAYRGLRGNVIDPQTREEIPDTYLGLIGELARTTPQARQSGTALADATLRLMELQKAGKDLPVELPAGWPQAVRRANLAAQLELLELAVRLSPGDRACWSPLRQLAAAGNMPPDAKNHWAQLIYQSCGEKYPDFVLAMLIPMVRTESDLATQQRLWEWLFGAMRSRADLAAQVRMEQGAMWESAGRIDLAGECYLDVIEKYANSGPFVIDALAKAEKALRDTGQASQVVDLYERTWNRIHRPREMAGPFVTQSNWWRVGQILVARLEADGKKEKADKVKEKLAARAE